MKIDREFDAENGIEPHEDPIRKLRLLKELEDETPTKLDFKLHKRHRDEYP